MLEELSNLPPEVLSHHMASLHSKDNPQGSPSLLLVQLLFTPHLLSNIWQNERFGKKTFFYANCIYSYLPTVLLKSELTIPKASILVTRNSILDT